MSAELVELPSFYAPPGFLLLARVEGDPVGCVGVRCLDAATGEIRRLLVRPQHRRLGLGRDLLAEATWLAAANDFTKLVLSTLPSMTAARSLYDDESYLPIAPYVRDPVEGVQFLGRRIGPSHPAAEAGTR